MKRILFVIALFVSIALQAQEFDYPTRIVNGQEVYEYPVQKGEGLYRISVNFGVTQEEIIKLNPELKTTGLKLGQTILVPVRKQAKKPILKTPAAVRKDTAAIRKDSVSLPLPKQVFKQLATSAPVVKEAEVTEEIFFEEDTMPVIEPDTNAVPGNTLQLALLLPLQADAQTYDLKMERFLKFYEGVLLALREEKRPNWKFEVYVYDIGKTEYKLRKVLALPEMEQMNAIIGPAYGEQIPAANDFVQQHHIACLLPFTNNVESLEHNKYLLQYNPIVPQGMRVVQFKQESDGNWDAFDDLMNRYFGVTTPPQTRPRYDILGYDLTRYFIPAVLNAMQAETETAWQQAFEAEYDGLQSTLKFRRVGDGGFMNTPLKLMPKATNIPDNNTDENK